MYDRVVSVYRPSQTAGATGNTVGDVGYIGVVQSPTAQEGLQLILSGLPAEIQAGAVGRRGSNVGDFPTDVVYAPTWDIFIPQSAISQYSIKDRDVLQDDEGYRYEVAQNYWNVLGYKLTTIRLEA